jgi:hypothetical protein
MAFENIKPLTFEVLETRQRPPLDKGAGWVVFGGEGDRAKAEATRGGKSRSAKTVFQIFAGSPEPTPRNTRPLLMADPQRAATLAETRLQLDRNRPTSSAASGFGRFAYRQAKPRARLSGVQEGKAPARADPAGSRVGINNADTCQSPCACIPIPGNLSMQNGSRNARGWLTWPRLEGPHSPDDTGVRSSNYSNEWMITSFKLGKSASNAAAPSITQPAYRMACS